MSRIPNAEEITKDWGDRCADFAADCACCQMWAMHDEIDRLRRELAEARAVAFREAAEIAETGDWYGQFQTSGDERRAKDIAYRIRAKAGEGR